MILDTSFLIDLLRNNPSAVRKGVELEGDPHEPLLTTSVNVFEIWQALASEVGEEKQRRALALLRPLGLLNLDFDCAKRGAEVHAALRAQGLEIDPEDSMIAGIALQHHQAVLTRNEKHFKRVPGLEVRMY